MVSPSASVADKVPKFAPATFSAMPETTPVIPVGVSLVPAILTVRVRDAERGDVALSATFTVNCSVRLCPVVSSLTAVIVSFNE